jgi:hypothetical protein
MMTAKKRREGGDGGVPRREAKGPCLFLLAMFPAIPWMESEHRSTDKQADVAAAKGPRA